MGLLGCSQSYEAGTMGPNYSGWAGASGGHKGERGGANCSGQYASGRWKRKGKERGNSHGRRRRLRYSGRCFGCDGAKQEAQEFETRMDQPHPRPKSSRPLRRLRPPFA